MDNSTQNIQKGRALAGFGKVFSGIGVVILVAGVILSATPAIAAGVIIAVIGGTMAIAGTPNLGLTGMNTLTLGMIASFLTLSRGFTNPISQISNQFNSIVTALAGASRIFAFMDAEPETDDGYVTLVNATEENGMLAETDHHTGLWAWKHPHSDGTVTYTPLKGDVRMYDVDFAYEEGKDVLHGVTVYAEPGQKVAFVGATGAGKTTIQNLICRYYDIQKGSKILCWYDIMTMSIPAYASTDKVVIAEQAESVDLSDIVISRPEEGVPFDPAFAVDPEFDLVINDQDLGKCDLPYYDGDTLMVPLRKISEALGYKVGWDAETGAITIEDANTQKATLFSRTKEVDIAGKLNIIDLSRKIENVKETVIKNGCTFVPVDFFKEFMNDVTVDGTKITVAAQKAELQ